VKRNRNLSRILDLVRKKQPDRDRWGDPASYGGEHWDSRAKQAARQVADGARGLEIGVGKGPSAPRFRRGAVLSGPI
jgi:hypothetical protein